MSDDLESSPTFSSSRRVGLGLHVLLACVLMLAIVVMLNFLGARHSIRTSWNADGRLELSPLTKHLLASVTNDVQVTVFFDTGEPLFESVSALLKEYRLACPQLEVREIDYIHNPTGASQLQDKYKLSANARDFVLFACQGRTRLVQGSELSDYDLSKLLSGQSREVKRTAFKGELLFTSAISEVTSKSRSKAYFLEGHQEMNPLDKQSPTAFASFAELLSLNNVAAEPLLLTGTNDVPTDCQLLVIAGPRTKLTTPELQKLDQYLTQGGRMFALFHHFGASGETGLENLLARWGVAVGSDVVLDNEHYIRDPGHIILTNYGTHAITRALAEPLVPMSILLPRSVGKRADLPLKADAPTVTELLLTSRGGVAHGDFRNGVPYQNPAADRRGAIPLAVAVEKGAVPGVTLERGSTRIVAVGDALFLDNELINELNNRHFAEKAVNWLLDRSHLMAGIGPQPIHEYKITVTQGQLLAMRWIMLGLMPGSVLGFGLLVWWRRRH